MPPCHGVNAEDQPLREVAAGVRAPDAISGSTHAAHVRANMCWIWEKPPVHRERNTPYLVTVKTVSCKPQENTLCLASYSMNVPLLPTSEYSWKLAQLPNRTYLSRRVQRCWETQIQLSKRHGKQQGGWGNRIAERLRNGDGSRPIHQSPQCFYKPTMADF